MERTPALRSFRCEERQERYAPEERRHSEAWEVGAWGAGEESEASHRHWTIGSEKEGREGPSPRIAWPGVVALAPRYSVALGR
jgi:hypothetical protein